MPERDGYIPGVPCWVDTEPPDPDAVARLLPRPVRLGVRGRDARRVGRPRTSSAASVAVTWRRVGSIPDGEPPMRDVEHVRVGRRAPTRRPPVVADAGGAVLAEPFDVMDLGRMAVVADPEGAVFCVWQAMEHRAPWS